MTTQWHRVCTIENCLPRHVSDRSIPFHSRSPLICSSFLPLRYGLFASHCDPLSVYVCVYVFLIKYTNRPKPLEKFPFTRQAYWLMVCVSECVCLRTVRFWLISHCLNKMASFAKWKIENHPSLLACSRFQSLRNSHHIMLETVRMILHRECSLNTYWI